MMDIRLSRQVTGHGQLPILKEMNTIYLQILLKEWYSDAVVYIHLVRKGIEHVDTSGTLRCTLIKMVRRLID